MKLAVVGSRGIKDKQWVYDQITKYIGEHPDMIDPVIISGGAEGVDSLAKAYAKDMGLDFVMFQPYFLLDKGVPFSNRHFFTRNKQIVFNADEVLVLWDGESRGTDFTRGYAESAKKPVKVELYYNINDEVI